MLWSVYWGNQIQPPLYNRSLYIQVPKNSVSSSGFNAMQMLTSSKDKILIHSKSAVSRLKKYILWILKSEFICEENINLWQIVRQQQFKKCTIDLASNATYVLQGVWEKSILRKNVIFNPSYKYWALVLLNTYKQKKNPFFVSRFTVFPFDDINFEKSENDVNGESMFFTFHCQVFFFTFVINYRICLILDLVTLR